MKQWKRTAAGIFAAAILCGALPTNTPVQDLFSGVVLTAHAALTASGWCGADTNEGGVESVVWSLDEEGTFTISGRGEMASYYTTSSPWKNNAQNIKRVVIENGVTSIGDTAFYYCQNLASVDIPDSVTSIGAEAFKECSSLTAVTIPDSVTSIGVFAFYETAWLNAKQQENPLVIVNGILIDGTTCSGEITIPDGVTSIGAWAFEECRSLTSVTIPDSVTSIGEGALAGCLSLTSVAIPDSMTSIPKYLFSSCSSLTSVTIPNSVTSIGDSAFYECSSLISITIPDSVTNIGSAAFRECSSMTSITIPDSVTSIGEGAFYDCSGLTSFTIPDSVTSIGKLTFCSCKSLTSITIPNSVISIGDSAFWGCGLTSLTIPDNVTSIGTDVLYACKSLTMVIMEHKTPPTIGKYALGSNSSGLKIYVPAASLEAYQQAETWSYYKDTLKQDGITASGICGNPEENNGENVTYSLCRGVLTISGKGPMKDYKRDIAPWREYSSDITEAVIENGVTSIGAHAFRLCKIMTQITIPDSVTSIGDRAFEECYKLSSVNIPDSVTSIGEYTFGYCYGFKSITIPDSVTIIGNSAFISCIGLTSVTIPENVTSIGAYAFYTCKKMVFVIIPDSVKSIENEAFACCDSLTSVYLESETPPAIGEFAFGNTPDDLKIYVPEGTVDAYKAEWSENADRITEISYFTEESCYPVISGGANKVHVGFKPTVPQGIEVMDYGLIYYNSGNVIHTDDLTLDNVGICGIKKAKFWSANITDPGCGVTAVGFVKYKDATGTEITRYTGELGGSFAEMTNAAKYVTLTRREPKAVVSNGKNKVNVGFDANVPKGYTVEDYGLIYYNSGNVIHTEHLTLNNVGACGIQKAKYWSAKITDNGSGVTAVGFVTVKDGLGNETTLYTEELGGSYTALSEEAAAKAVKLTRRENKAVVSGGKNKVYVGFDADVAEGYSIEEYGLLYYNSGNVIHTEHLVLENEGVCGIQRATFWGANITDKGDGVVCVGFVKVKSPNGYITTLYTGELGSSFAAVSEAAAANAVTFTRHANKAATANGKNKVYCGFTANLAAGYTVENYGLLYYNSGNVIHTEHLTLDNVGVCGIQNAKYWSANITDKGYGVVCVGYVKVKDANGYVTTLYTGELGAKYTDLV